MKGLRKVLTPFAPDQSGAVSVLYTLGALTVIIDAGGCTGNICGFDEPRWRNTKSAVFSAGLRDMDAIMGADEALADKIAAAANEISPSFIALVGTPVPAVTATDYRFLKKAIEKKTSLKVICVDTNGMELFDKGQEKTLFAVYDEFAGEAYEINPERVNILGACPVDFAAHCSALTLDEIKSASAARMNIAVSPAAVKTARLLKERFKTPYKIYCPPSLWKLPETDYENKNVLIVHQHVLADTLRKEIYRRGAAKADAASWFMLCEDIRKPGDISLKEEDDFENLVKTHSFDIIIADEALKPLAKDFKGVWLDYPHHALSGRI